MKLSQALEGFWLDKRLRFSKTTIANYQWAFDRFSNFIGNQEVHEIKAIDVRRFLNHLFEDEGLSKRSVFDNWKVLSSFWTWLEIELGIPHIIRGRVAAPQYPKKVIKPLSQNEVRRLMDAVEYEHEWTTRSGKVVRSKRPTARRERAILLTLVDTGIRASELCALTVEDYDPKLGRLHIRHGKGDKARYVMPGKRAQTAIALYLTGRDSPKPSSSLFASRGGKQLNRVNLLHLLNRLGETAGVLNVHPHRFRHTFAIEFLRNGGQMLVLKELLGHTKMDMVMTYVTIAEQDIDSSIIHSPADNWTL